MCANGVDCGHCIPHTNIPRAAGWDSLKGVGAVLVFAIAGYGVSMVAADLMIAAAVAAGIFLAGFAAVTVWVVHKYKRPRGGVQWGTSAIADRIHASVDPAFADELEARKTRPAIEQPGVTVESILAAQNRVTVTAEQVRQPVYRVAP